MAGLRRLLMWATLLAIAALGVLCIVGAFLGAERASALFGSVPMVVGWVLLCALLAACLLTYRRLLRAPAHLALHLGPLLVVAGSMWGSPAGHRLAARLGAAPKIPDGFMTIREGQASDVVTDASGRALGRLPFEVRLNDFRILYYETEGHPWQLLAEVPSPAGGAELQRVRVEWSVGREVDIPSSDLRLTVLAYEPRARPMYEDGSVGWVEVTPEDGEARVLPARPGASLELSPRGPTLTVERVFSHLAVREGPGGPEAYDVPGFSDEPAVFLNAERAGQGASSVFVTPRGMAHGEAVDLPDMRYVAPEPVGLAADAGADAPGMELVVESDRRKLHRFILPDPDVGFGAVSLAPLTGRPESGLYLVEPPAPVREYESELEVLREGRPVEHRPIQVNAPLHFGGYHLHQHAYDSEEERFTVLRVRSDSGLLAIWAGYALLAAGAFWVCWRGALAGRAGGGGPDGA